MAQQVSLALGITLGGYALTVSSLATGEPTSAAINFTFAFLGIGVVSATSAWMMAKLPKDAGAEMASRAREGREVAEPKAEQRSAT